MGVSQVGKTIENIIKETANKTTQRNTGNLGKDDFLKLLVTQLKYQDPLQPTDDKEFIAQMAQFSALEQMQNVSSGINQSMAFSMIGKYVESLTTDENTGETKITRGIVDHVRVEKGKAFVVVDGTEIPVEKVTSVYNIDNLFRNNSEET